MAVVGTGSWQKSLWPGIDNWFNQAYDSFDEEHKALFTSRTSDKQFEQTVGQSGLGLAQIKPQGQGVSYDDTQQTYVHQYDRVVRALGFVMTYEAYRDNQYNLPALSKDPKMLAKSMRETKEHIGANVLNNGFDSNFTMGSSSDALELFSTAHLSGPYGAVRSNLLTAADLSEVTLEDAMISIAGAVDPRGLKIKVMPDALVLPRQLNFTAGRILGSEMQSDSANHNTNVLRDQNSLPGGKTINHYLTDADAWFVTTSINKSGEGLVHYQNWAMEFSQDNDFDTLNMKCKAFEAYSFGWDDFQGIYGNAGA
jgi:hypothetical protein